VSAAEGGDENDEFKCNMSRLVTIVNLFCHCCNYFISVPSNDGF
jgi:hypothetical protein